MKFRSSNCVQSLSSQLLISCRLIFKLFSCLTTGVTSPQSPAHQWLFYSGILKAPNIILVKPARTGKARRYRLSIDLQKKIGWPECETPYMALPFSLTTSITSLIANQSHLHSLIYRLQLSRTKENWTARRSSWDYFHLLSKKYFEPLSPWTLE